MGLYLGKEKINNISVGISEATQGIDTSDATATTNDILSSKTAYVNGEKITGTINNLSGSTIFGTTINGNYTRQQIPRIYFSSNSPKIGYIDKTTILNIETRATIYGDADVSDVAAGKTFTSINGLKLTGTASSGSSSSSYGVYSFNHDLNITDYQTVSYNWTKPSECNGEILAIHPRYNSAYYQTIGTGPNFSECLDYQFSTLMNMSTQGKGIIFSIDFLTESFLYYNGNTKLIKCGVFADDCYIHYDNTSLSLPGDNSSTADGETLQFLLMPAADNCLISDYIVIYR